MNIGEKQVDIIAPKVEKREYELPPPGPILATLKHIKDEGMTTRFGDKPRHTIVFVWETDAIDSHGARIMVFERMTLTLSHMGRLASRIEAMTGTLPQEDEPYSVHKLVGGRAMLMIKHAKTSKGTFANVVGAFPAGDGKAGADRKRGVELGVGDDGTSFPGGDATSDKNAA